MNENQLYEENKQYFNKQLTNLFYFLKKDL